MSRSKIMIVKDDRQFIEDARRALEARGFDVVVCTDSGRAGEVARREHPDLVLTGMVMEHLYSGCEVLGELRHEHDTRDIPVVMVSGVTTDTGFRLDQGGHVPAWLSVSAFLHEPVDFEGLAERVAEIVAERETVAP